MQFLPKDPLRLSTQFRVGRGVKRVYTDEDRHLIFEMTDGQEIDIGVVEGEKGETGPQGPQGEPGPAGATGPTGEPGIVISSTQPTDEAHPVWLDPDGDASAIPWVPQPTTAAVGQIVKVKAVDSDGRITEVEAVDMPSGGGGAKEWKLLQDVMVTADTDKQTSGVTYIVGDNGVHAIVFDKDANGAAFAVGELHIFGILMGSANSSLAVLSSNPTENVAVAAYRNALGTSYAVYQISITQVGGKWVTDQADKCTQYANQTTPLAPTTMSNNPAFAGDMSKLLTSIPDAVTLSKISIMTSAAQIGMSGRLLIYGR